jgi:hypothetical protein
MPRKCPEKHTKAHIPPTIQWIELKLENVKHISTGGNNLTRNCHEMSRKCPEKYIKAHISSFINLRTESKPENVKHISIYPKNTKKTYKKKFLGGNNLI